MDLMALREPQGLGMGNGGWGFLLDYSVRTQLWKQTHMHTNMLVFAYTCRRYVSLYSSIHFSAWNTFYALLFFHHTGTNTNSECITVTRNVRRRLSRTQQVTALTHRRFAVLVFAHSLKHAFTVPAHVTCCAHMCESENINTADLYFQMSPPLFEDINFQSQLCIIFYVFIISHSALKILAIDVYDWHVLLLQNLINVDYIWIKLQITLLDIANSLL